MLDNISLVLIIIGALNWGIIGLFGVDLIGMLFGGQLTLIPRNYIYLGRHCRHMGNHPFVQRKALINPKKDAGTRLVKRVRRLFVYY